MIEKIIKTTPNEYFFLITFTNIVLSNDERIKKQRT